METRLQWDPSFNLGIAIIDEQHQDILESFNRVAEAQAGGDQEYVEQRLHELAHAFIHHFRFEEEMMAEASYEHLKSHCRVHNLFLRRLFNFMARVESGESVVPEIGVLVERWLFSHILQEDIGYVGCLGEELNRLVRPRRSGPLSALMHPGLSA